MSAWYEPPTTYADGKCTSTIHNRPAISPKKAVRIQEYKPMTHNDPKTIWGWALVAFRNIYK